jgi:integrase
MKLRKMPIYETAPDGSKSKRLSPKWYAVFVDYSETLRRLPLFEDRKASDEMARKIDRLNSMRAAGETIPPDLHRYVETMPPRIRGKLAAWGILSNTRVAAGKPLVDHLSDWRGVLLASGNTAHHANVSHNRVKRVFDQCDFRFWSDLQASKVQTCLADLRKGDAGKAGISAASANYHLTALKGFARWMVRDGRATESPVTHLQGFNVKTDRRHDRRALSAAELRWLLQITASAPERFGMTGDARSLLYRVAAETGLRAGELRSLTRASFALGGDEPSVTIAAAYAKNRRQDTLPLRANTAKLLAEHLQGKMPVAVAFAMPQPSRVVKMLRADLDSARKVWLQDAGSNAEGRKRAETSFLLYCDGAGRVADFHALRHTFISNLAGGGVHPKTAQALARHSTITLTMDRYSHVYRDDLTAALDALPDLSQPLFYTCTATGTDDLAARLSPPLSPVGDRRRSGVESGAAMSGKGSEENHPQKLDDSGVSQGETEMGRGGIEPPTHGFSVHCSTS